jgi:hypothetical protein
MSGAGGGEGISPEIRYYTSLRTVEYLLASNVENENRAVGTINQLRELMSCIEAYLRNELNIAPKKVLVDIVKNTVIVDSNRVKEYIEITLEAIDAEGKRVSKSIPLEELTVLCRSYELLRQR